MSFSGYLLLLLQVSCFAEEMTELWAEEGSSVMMHAPAIRNISLAEWEYVREDTSKLILDYYAESQSITIDPAYKGRVVFYENNGSLVLQKLREMDSGIYRATVNLMQDKATTTTLRVIRMEAWKWLTMCILGLLCISSLLWAAYVIWMPEDGHSAACIQLWLFLPAGMVAMALTVVAMSPRPAVLTHFRSKGWHLVILCITATMLVVNLLFSSLLLHNFHQLHEWGCSEAFNLNIGFGIPTVAVLSMLLVLFLW